MKNNKYLAKTGLKVASENKDLIKSAATIYAASGLQKNDNKKKKR